MSTWTCIQTGFYSKETSPVLLPYPLHFIPESKMGRKKLSKESYYFNISTCSSEPLTFLLNMLILCFGRVFS